MKRKVKVKDATRAMHFEPDKKMHRPSVAELRNLIDELPDECSAPILLRRGCRRSNSGI